MPADIAIVVVAYNRPVSISRLLSSLAKALYDEEYRHITLYISIDYSGCEDCYKIAGDFTWAFGEKKIIQYTESQGLKKHIFQCGDLCENHDAVIVLEDDLYVSPEFYRYAQAAYSFYKTDERVAGIALYSYRFNETALLPFEAIADGYDNYFLQVPCSWGQMWTKKQWTSFRSSILKNNFVEEHPRLPEQVKLWPTKSSWKKICYSYLVATGRYFVYPHISLTTNFGDIGQHYHNEVLMLQSSLLLKKKDFSFSSFGDSASVYDQFFELDSKFFSGVLGFDAPICIDINGKKPLSGITEEYIISSKFCNKPLKKYPLALYPYENNILFEINDSSISQNFLSLGFTKDFKERLNVDRRAVDVKRIFRDEGLLLETGRNEIKNTLPYRIGNNLLYPLEYIKKQFRSFLKRS